MTMSLAEAMVRVYMARSGHIPKYAVDYENHWIFWMVPINNKKAIMYDAFTAIDKNSGKITGFQPLGLKNPSSFFKAAIENRIDFIK